MKLTVKKRKLAKKKVKVLLEAGTLPGVVYGPKRDSVNIKVDVNGFKKVFDKVGFGKMIDLSIEGEKKESKALVREVQYDPVTDSMIHVSLFEVDVSKPITTEIPVETRGVSKAVEENVGFLVTPLESLEVRCLPDKIPDKLVINISDLDEIGDSISVADLVLPEGVELTGVVETATLAYIAPPQKEIVEEEKEEVLVGEEVEEGEEAEGEELKEGEEVEEGEEAEKEEGAAEKGKGEGEETMEKK